MGFLFLPAPQLSIKIIKGLSTLSTQISPRFTNPVITRETSLLTPLPPIIFVSVCTHSCRCAGYISDAEDIFLRVQKDSQGQQAALRRDREYPFFLCGHKRCTSR